MSGNAYDPVTTTDSSYLADDDWGLSLPPLKYKKFSGSTTSSRLKSFCFGLKQHPKCVSLSLLVVLCFIMLIVVISVASQRESNRLPTGNEPQWKATKQGIEFYPLPQDGSILISFTPDKFDHTADQPIERDLNQRIEAYKVVNQLDDKFVDCNSTYHPHDKVCRITTSSFYGDNECTPQNHYGYFGGMPCIFAQLVLPDHVSIREIDEQSPLWKQQEAASKSMDPKKNEFSIPVTCQGATEKDDDLLHPRVNQKFVYMPSSGFPSYIYRPRAASMPHLRPAMMIQVTSLLDRQLVHINCTVWGQLYDFQDKLISHPLLTGSFAVFIDR